MGNCITEKTTHLYVSSNGQLRAGLCGMQGWRPEMEDEHIAQDMPTRRDHIFLCVFDGHGGAGAAKFAEHNIIDCIENTSEWKRYVSDGAKNAELLGQALCKAFEDLDEKLR